MDPQSLSHMLARDKAEWHKLAALLDANPEAVIHEPGAPPWTARDVFSHFARWIAHSTADLESTVAGDRLPRPTGTDDEINARWQAEDAAFSFAEAKRRAQVAFDRRIAILESTPPGRWTPALDEIALADGWPHIEAHRRWVEAAVGESGPAVTP